MTKAWVWLLLAGLAEVAWSQSIRPTESFTRPLPTLLCFLLAVAAVYPLTLALRELPVGTAYAVFTGIGAAGAVTLGILLSGDPVELGRITAIVLIVTGVIIARTSGG